MPLAEEGATSGVSLGAALADCCNRGNYLGGDLRNKTLVFDVKSLSSSAQFIAVSANLESDSNTALKYVPVYLDPAAGWQTQEIDFIQLGSPRALEQAQNAHHYFSVFSTEAVHYQIANIRIVDKVLDRATEGLAVRRDEASIADATAITNTPLLSGFYSTWPYAEKREDGDAAGTFGFILNDDQSIVNFDSIDMTPYGLMRPLFIRGGEWTTSEEGRRIDLRMCHAMAADNGDLSDGYGAEPYPQCSDYGVRHRTWQKLSVTDTDQDGTPDRLYVLETISRFHDADGDGLYDPEVGDQLYFEDSRTNFYDANSNYDLMDVDGDGAPNDEDALPNDFRESVDTDLDGIGNNADDDDDNDGVPDVIDAFPLDPYEVVDTDGDGIGNATDADDDGDGVPDRLDVFPYDPTESVDTDGDGIGDNRDEDDDNDNIADGQDESPRGEDYEDTDGDGVLNRDDADADGDGVPDVVAELLEDERSTLAYVSRLPSGEDVIPGHATGYGAYTATMRGDGTFLDGWGNFAGNWKWDIESQAFYFEQTEPDVRMERLSEDRFTNVDWERYDQAGRPQINLDYFWSWRYQITPDQSENYWTVLWDSGVEVYVSSEQPPISADNPWHINDFILDPSQPVAITPLGSEPAREQMFAHERMVVPLDEGLIVGQWGIDAILPGDPDGCLSSDWNTCGRLFTFHSDGTGEVEGRYFNWTYSDPGAVLVTMYDGSGSIELIPHHALEDGSVSLLMKTQANGFRYIIHTGAVRKELGISAELDVLGLLHDSTFVTGFDVTSPYQVLGIDGKPIDGFGFQISASNEVVNFDASYLNLPGCEIKEGCS